jgi:hypothetical protein
MLLTKNTVTQQLQLKTTLLLYHTTGFDRLNGYYQVYIHTHTYIHTYIHTYTQNIQLKLLKQCPTSPLYKTYGKGKSCAEP